MATPRLWTPIANALEAYRRRVVIEPGAAYEHIWRLIHVQEALAVCLASLMSARMVAVSAPTIGDLQEALTGLRPPGTREDDDVESAPWGGSVGSWIELLRRFGKTEQPSEDPFLSALADYLSSSPNRPLAFSDAWAKVAPVPATFRDAGLDRVGRLGAVNSFRNKLAHVPVPQRLLEELHRGLRVEVLDGLTDKFDAEKDAGNPGFAATSFRPPLTGILVLGSTYVTGSGEVGTEPSAGSSKLRARFAAKGAALAEWSVEPFFHIDGEAKVALLFRVNDLRRGSGATGYEGEFHRFAAELEPVTYVSLEADVVESWLPKPAVEAPVKASTAKPGEPSTRTKVTTPITSGREPAQTTPAADAEALRELADSSFSRRDYPDAVMHYDTLSKTGGASFYNDVARSKHGAALWRTAVRQLMQSGAKVDDLKRAVDLLTRAEAHRDPRYAARSAYEASKALWHLWKVAGDLDYLRQSLDAAERAVGRSPGEVFISWQARVASDAAVAMPQGRRI